MTLSDPSGRGPTLGPRRLHPVSPVLDLLPAAQQGFVPIIVLAVSLGRWGLLASTVGVALVLGWRVLAWSRRTYCVEDGVLRIDEGIIGRSKREIPLSRIQQVDLRRKLRHRVAGVVAVRIDTAGGGSGAEAVLDALSEADALELRTALLGHLAVFAAVPPAPPVTAEVPPAGYPPPPPGHEAPWPPAVGPATPLPNDGQPYAGPGDLAPPVQGVPAPPLHQPEVVAALGTRDLALAGVTGSGLLAGLSIVGFAFLVLDALPANISRDLSSEVADVLSRVFVLGVAVLLLVPLWLVVAAGSSVLRDHEFCLTRYGPDLHLRRGLLDQREATLALHRVQAVWVLDNPIRRRLGLCAVQIQSAASGTDANSDVARVTIPLVRRHELPRILSMVLPEGGELPGLVPAPRAALRRARVRAGALASVFVLGVLALARHPYALVAVLAFVPAWAYAGRAYEALGHARTARTVVTRVGAVLRRTAVVPVAKTQSCLLRSTPFQRRVDLATLLIQVAGRGPTVAVVDGDAAVLGGLRNGVLGAPAARVDERSVRRRTQAELGSSERPAEAEPRVSNYRAHP